MNNMAHVANYVYVYDSYLSMGASMAQSFKQAPFIFKIIGLIPQFRLMTLMQKELVNVLPKVGVFFDLSGLLSQEMLIE